MYAHLAVSLGWTWEYIDKTMTLSRLNALNKYWANYPPIHTMIAAYFGLGKKEEKPADEMDLAKLLALNAV